MCRRCGAAIPSGPEATRVAMPSTMHRHRATAGVATPLRQAPPSSASTLSAAAAKLGPPDTFLPGSGLPGALPRPDNLLPRALRPSTTGASTTGPAGVAQRRPSRAAELVRSQWRRILVLAIVAVALTMSVVAAWPVVFSSGSAAESSQSTGVQATFATGILRTVVGGGRTLYAPGHTFSEITPAVLSSFSDRVPVVDATTPATPGVVSLRVNSGQMVTLATPADARHCVFARDEPAKARTSFVTVQTTDCRAGAAPARGWKPR